MAGDPRSTWLMLWPADRTVWQRFGPSIWLAFLALPLSASLGRDHVGVAHGVVVVVVALAFGALFAWASSRAQTEDGRRRWTGRTERLVAPLFVAAPLFLSLFDAGGWIYCYVYSLFPLMRLWRQGIRWRVVMAVAAVALGTGLATGASTGDLLASQCVILGTGGSWLGFGRVIEANAMLREAQEDRAQAAVAEERLRFARDLHDLLGHSLSVVALKSEVAGRLVAADPDRARTEIAEIEQVARRALREVREAVTGYRRVTLAVELASARSALAAGGVTWTESVVDDGYMPADVEAVLAWALREGVTNLLRHSKARSAALAVEVVDGMAIVTVTDDGVGPSPARPGLPVGGGSGLVGLRERAALVDGAMDCGPGPGGRGFRLRLRVPVAVGQDAPEGPVQAAPTPAQTPAR